MPAPFIRGVGQSAVRLPAISAAYALVERRHLPMATATLNIVQRLGGPTLTPLCVVSLARMLEARASSVAPNA